MVEAPAGTDDYVSNDSIQALQEASENEAERLAVEGNVPNPIVRDTLPNEDFDPGSDITDDPLSATWNVTIASGSETTVSGGEEVEVYDLDSDRGNADDRAFTLYGVQLLNNGAATDVDLVEVRIRDSSGRLLERAQVEGLQPVSDGKTFEESHTTFRSPFAFGVSDNRTIHYVFDGEVTADGADGNQDTDFAAKLLMVTAEKEGREIGNV